MDRAPHLPYHRLTGPEAQATGTDLLICYGQCKADSSDIYTLILNQRLIRNKVCAYSPSYTGRVRPHHWTSQWLLQSLGYLQCVHRLSLLVHSDTLTVHTWTTAVTVSPFWHADRTHVNKLLAHSNMLTVHTWTTQHSLTVSLFWHTDCTHVNNVSLTISTFWHSHCAHVNNMALTVSPFWHADRAHVNNTQYKTPVCLASCCREHTQPHERAL